MPLPPDDRFNRELVDQVHPADWRNPVPADRYHLVVIGAGTAGLVAAAGAAAVGARVALVERRLMGGDCLNFGCVPSKALLAAAHVAANVRHAIEYGVGPPNAAAVDFPQVMERMRRLRARISHHDSAARFQSLGVDVFLGNAMFTAEDAIQVDDAVLRFRKAAICTGARPALPPIAGLKDAGCLTNETLFSLTQLPARLAVLGGGPIGCELAQAFARFGARVTLIEQGSRLLPRDDPDASGIVAAALERDGVELLFETRLEQVQTKGGEKSLSLTRGGESIVRVVDEILVAVGRTPNVEGLELDRAGIECDERGVRVDDRLRTANRRVFAAGDVCSRWKFTHAADFQARLVVQNALFFGRARASGLLIPWCTYTSPAVAATGLQPNEAAQRNIPIDTLEQKFAEVDRAIVDGEEEGFVKLHLARGTDRILGGTVVGAHAGELISEITLAIRNRVGLKQVGSTIHPYPTHAEAIRKLGDAWNRRRLTPFIQKLLKLVLRFS